MVEQDIIMHLKTSLFELKSLQIQRQVNSHTAGEEPSYPEMLQLYWSSGFRVCRYKVL